MSIQFNQAADKYIEAQSVMAASIEDRHRKRDALRKELVTSCLQMGRLYLSITGEMPNIEEVEIMP